MAWSTCNHQPPSISRTFSSSWTESLYSLNGNSPPPSSFYFLSLNYLLRVPGRGVVIQPLPLYVWFISLRIVIIFDLDVCLLSYSVWKKKKRLPSLGSLAFALRCSDGLRRKRSAVKQNYTHFTRVSKNKNSAFFSISDKSVPYSTLTSLPGVSGVGQEDVPHQRPSSSPCTLQWPKAEPQPVVSPTVPRLLP